jgi:hypothetical protein
MKNSERSRRRFKAKFDRIKLLLMKQRYEAKRKTA